MTLQTFYLILTIICIGSQVFNIYYVFYEFNSFKNWVRWFQSGLFCGILSMVILASALSGLHLHAFFGALVESALNIWYYDQKFKNPRKTGGGTDYWKKFVKNWPGYFLAVIMPGLIWYCSWRLVVVSQNT